MNSQVFLECKCIEEKKHRLIFDGGTSGQYSVDVCETCYQENDTEFLVTSINFLSQETV